MTRLQLHWLSMLAKFLLILFLSIVSLNAQQQSPQDVEVLAKTVTKDGDVAHAVGNVVLYSEKYLITADEAYYNYVTGDLELFGNITMLEGIEYASRSGHTKLNLQTKKGTSDPVFFFDEKSKIWLKCENAVLEADDYITQKAIVSSCNTQNPDWKIAFTSGELNKESKWLSLYNPVFYVSDVPVFYLPYFAFSTDQTRRSGLLKPDIGMGNKDGFHYMQPIYWAPEKDWDLEVRPQISTNRGEGIYAQYRFVDTPVSKGVISVGTFFEKDSYVKKEDLKNNEHHGFDIKYDRAALLSKQNSNIKEDGLWIDIHYLNDIDYWNTLDNTQDYDRLSISRINYYIKQEQDYFGLYAKYYIDTSKLSNSNTLQELPVFQYHRFSTPLFFDNLLYSVNYEAKNYTRSEGVTAFQNEVRTPLTFYKSFFDDYLHLSISENIYMTHVSYSSETDGSYLQQVSNYHKFDMYTELAKNYDKFFHTMYFGVERTVPSYDDTQGTKYTNTFLNAISSEDIIPLDLVEKNTVLNFKQYFYDNDGEKRLSHFLKQAYYDERIYHYGDLENEVKYYINENFSIGDTVHYSNEYSQISRNQISINYDEQEYKVSLRHTSVDRTYENNKLGKDYSYVTLAAETSRWENMTIFTTINYDYENDDLTSWNLGFKKIKNCWDYSLIYKQSLKPKQTSSGVDYVNNKGVMLVFSLYPIGNINYNAFSTTSQKNTTN